MAHSAARDELRAIGQRLGFAGQLTWRILRPVIRLGTMDQKET